MQEPSDQPEPDASPVTLVQLAASLPADGLWLPDEASLQAFAQPLHEAILHALSVLAGPGAHAPLVLSLRGDLGAGKSTLARALLRRFGHAGSVKSPTYTLFETYEVGGLNIAHVDLYRVVDPEELDMIGFDELLATHALVLIEWASQGGDRVPIPQASIDIDAPGSGGRRVRLDVAPTASTL